MEKRPKKLLLFSDLKLANKHGIGDELKAHFSVSADNPKNILYVSYARKDSVQDDKETEVLKTIGMDLVSAKDIAPKNKSDKVKAWLKIMDEKKIEGIYVTGGNTFRLLNELQETGLGEAIKTKVEDGIPYLGASAGANVVCPTIMTTNDMPIVQPKSFYAMNLVPFQINPHYVGDKAYYAEENTSLAKEFAEKGFFGRLKFLGGEIIKQLQELIKLVEYKGETRDQRIEEFFQENVTPVVGLRDGTALDIEDDKVRILGGKPYTLFLKDKVQERSDGNRIKDPKEPKEPLRDEK